VLHEARWEDLRGEIVEMFAELSGWELRELDALAGALRGRVLSRKADEYRAATATEAGRELLRRQDRARRARAMQDPDRAALVLKQERSKFSGWMERLRQDPVKHAEFLKARADRARAKRAEVGRG
jgi:hypothetical protein